MKTKSIYIQAILILFICLLVVLIFVFSTNNSSDNVEIEFSAEEDSESSLKHNVEEPTCFCITVVGDFVFGTKNSIITISPNGKLKNTVETPDFKNAGSVIVFPSFMEHQVTPVTKGTRYSLVAWFVGPPFK